MFQLLLTPYICIFGKMDSLTIYLIVSHFYKGGNPYRLCNLISHELLTFVLYFLHSSRQENNASVVADFDIETSTYITVAELETILNELQNMTSKAGYMNITVFGLTGDTPSPTAAAPTSVATTSITPTSSVVYMMTSVTSSEMTSSVASQTASPSMTSKTWKF